MFINTVASEWTKLRTTASFWWTTALFIFFALGWAALTGFSTIEAEGGFPTLWASSIVVVVYLLGFAVLMIQSVMLVTTEYRYNLQSATYLATPRRWTVALAKLLLFATFAAALTFLSVIAAFYVAKWTAPESAAALFQPFQDDRARDILWIYPASAAAVVLLSQGVSYLLRQTAGSVSFMLIWFLALEQIFRLIPRIGSDVVGYLPFENLNAFINRTDLQNIPWDSDGSGAYFFLWAVVIWLTGVLVLHRRDA